MHSHVLHCKFQTGTIQTTHEHAKSQTH